MAITTRDQLIAALAASIRQPFMKVGIATVAGLPHAFWRSSGFPAAAAAGPANGSGQANTSATQGALTLPSQVNTSYLSGFDCCGTTQGTLMLFDRVAEWGVNAAVNTAQSMSAVTLPTRATSWTDMQLWLEVETALGATQTGNITIAYTDQGNAAGSTTLGQMAASAPIGRASAVPLAAGDTGVRSVTTVTLTTASTGKFNAVLRKQLGSINIVGTGDSRNLGYPETDLEIIGSAACLELLWMPGTTNVPTVLGGFSVSQG